MDTSQTKTVAEKQTYLNSFANCVMSNDLDSLHANLASNANSVGFSSIEIENDLVKKQIDPKTFNTPLPQAAKEIHIIAGGLNNLLPAYIYEAAKESSKTGGKCQLDRIALYNFSITDIKGLLEYMGNHFDVNYFHPTFDFMTPISKVDSQGDYSLTELFKELKTWDKRPDHPAQPHIKVCFTSDEILGPNLSSIVTNRQSLPHFIDLHVRNSQTANVIERQAGIRVGVLL